MDERSYSFLNALKSSHLSSIIEEYTAYQNNVDPEYSFVYLSSIDSWKRKSTLKKAERIQYLEEQLFGPLLFLLNQFDCGSVRNSVHFTYFLTGKLPGDRRRSWRKRKYWSTAPRFVSSTMESVCHFIQKEGETGVHLQNGYVLSCAHVIASDTDPEGDGGDGHDGDAVIDRIGRIKYVVFANGSIYKTECVAVNEADDLSLLRIDFDSEIKMDYHEERDHEKKDHEERDHGIGTAILAETAPEIKCQLFCIGNPSNIDPEGDGNTDFEPKIFHLSFGRLLMIKERSDGLGEYGHCCWTYWGHSGAPLFNDRGHVVALHNSWDDQTGMRHAVRWEKIEKFIQLYLSKK